jgi:hypothetical protein
MFRPPGKLVKTTFDPWDVTEKATAVEDAPATP